jgi:RNA recognition motif-containing protein
MVSCPIFLYLCQFYLKVHFGATKDALSRHFNKFGAVLKVVIVTNAATGQPTGSAYVEFLHKESAERALSLNGTSFMARILKVLWSMTKLCPFTFYSLHPKIL